MDEPIYSELSGKAAANHGTHVAYSASAPAAPGTANAGAAATVARSDHVHPAQTTITGNAASATKLATARSIALTGDATGTASFNGTANASIATTLANTGVTANSYGPAANGSAAFGGAISIPQITVDSKGRATSAATRTITLPANKNPEGLIFVKGTQTASTNAFAGQALSIEALREGMQIMYYLPFAGTSSAATLELTLKDGSTSGPIPCYYATTTRLTTHLPANNVAIFTYLASNGTVSTPGWWMNYAYNTDTWDRLTWATMATVNEDIHRYKWLAYGHDGLGFPIFPDNKTSTTVASTWTVSQREIMLGTPILYYNRTSTVTAATATVSASYLFASINASPVYNINVASLTAYKHLFLRGSIGPGGGFIVHPTNYWTQTMPTSDDGYYYLYMGYMYSTSNLRLSIDHPVFFYKGSGIQLYAGRPAPHAATTNEFGVGSAAQYGHVKASSASPLAAGTATLGTDNGLYAREGHIHPAQTTISGNAGSATKLATARTISLSGDATGSASFNGSANAAIATTLANSGVTAGAYGPATSATAAFGGTISVPQVTVDAKGRVTAAAARTITLPANPNVNTMVTNTLSTTAKAYVTGTTTATTSTGTQVFDTGVYLDNTAGHLTATQFNGKLNGAATSASSAATLTTARTIALTGAVTGSGSFNGSANLSIATALAAHTHSEYLPINTGTTNPTGTARYNCNGYLYATRIYGAIWNDYAEYRACDEPVKSGMVVTERGDVDKVSLSGRRLAKNAMLVSDTYGFAIGRSSETDVPVAVSGRVLAYTDKARTAFKTGDVVCAGKHGTVSRMRRWEMIFFPDRILGTVSHIPAYTHWNGIAVDDRIWIKVR